MKKVFFKDEQFQSLMLPESVTLRLAAYFGYNVKPYVSLYSCAFGYCSLSTSWSLTTISLHLLTGST